MRFPNYLQSEAKDCGPTCLKIVAKHFGKEVHTQTLRQYSETNRIGSTLLGLSEAAEKIGFKTMAVSIGLDQLAKSPLPCIVHWGEAHYVVVYKVTKNRVYVSDPAFGKIFYDATEFTTKWIGPEATEQVGVALFMEPELHFHQKNPTGSTPSFGFGFVHKLLTRYRKFILQLGIGLFISSSLQLAFPFLTQAVIDIGVKHQDLGFIYLILLSQLLLFAGKTSAEVLQSWILLHLSTRINISLVSDFFIKLMKLPIAYFDSRLTGDFLQRINDHERIEKILTSSTLSTFFSLFNLIIFSAVLFSYSAQIFLVFITGTCMYFGWIAYFLKRRKVLDYKKFDEVSQEQSKVVEMINGMQEIRLHNAERKMRWNWESLQVRLFKVEIKHLKLEQIQMTGSNFINEIKNILITILAATLVIENEISLGMMLAISYIIGQLNAPVAQSISYIRDLQDARISLERLGEIHTMEEEENPEAPLSSVLPEHPSIILDQVSFRYKGDDTPVLRNISMVIPSQKVTAIVGTSGSGKTTLLKLLLGIYTPEDGQVLLDEMSLSTISPKVWRAHCGVVMQEGFIFNDSIAENIAVGADQIIQSRLDEAMTIANIAEYVDQLPKSYHTKIGVEGIGLSTGQKQRLLLARAVYKNPDFLLLDEATSSLDAKNERVIMENLKSYLNGRTTVIIAHRLSTVKDADQIIVLEKGRICEMGTHESLITKKGAYYELIKNQLELGN